MKALAILALAPLATAQGAVHTVDDDLPADYPEIQLAINAAADGDLILVRPGSYASALIDAKSLTIQVDGPPLSASANGAVSVFGAVPPGLGVSNLAAGQSVIVHGLAATAWGYSTTDVAFSAKACAGPVVLEDCSFVNGAGRAASVTGCASVTFVRSTLDAGLSLYDDFISTYLTQTGLEAQASAVCLYDSEVKGSLGPDATMVLFSYFPPGAGGDAARVTGSTLFASGSAFTGGAGGSADATTCAAGFDGGDGIAFDAGSTVRVLDCTVVAGAGGLGTCGLSDGAAGSAYTGPAGVVQQLPGLARSLAVGSPVAQGTQIDLAIDGEPGDAALLLIGLEPTPAVYYPAYAAVQHLAPPFLGLNAGTIPPSGTLVLSFPIPLLGPGFEFARYPSQALFVTPAAAIFHAGPSCVVIKGAGL